MAGREVAVKKYVVRLSAGERERLEDLRLSHPLIFHTNERV